MSKFEVALKPKRVLEITLRPAYGAALTLKSPSTKLTTELQAALSTPGPPGPAGGGGGSQEIFVQDTRPVSAGPWMWWKKSADGTKIVNLIINDGL